MEPMIGTFNSVITDVPYRKMKPWILYNKTTRETYTRSEAGHSWSEG